MYDVEHKPEVIAIEWHAAKMSENQAACKSNEKIK
jgi:hypothetical protein